MTAYTHSEIAEMFKVSPRTIVKQIKDGNLKALKIGSAWRITDESLEQFQKERTAKYKRKTA